MWGLAGATCRDVGTAEKKLGLLAEEGSRSLHTCHANTLPSGPPARLLLLGSGPCLHPPARTRPRGNSAASFHPPRLCPPPPFLHNRIYSWPLYSGPEMGGEEKMLLNGLIVRRFQWLLLFQTHSLRTYGVYLLKFKYSLWEGALRRCSRAPVPGWGLVGGKLARGTSCPSAWSVSPQGQ